MVIDNKGFERELMEEGDEAGSHHVRKVGRI
jgi:hypothetical protein